METQTFRRFTSPVINDLHEKQKKMAQSYSAWAIAKKVQALLRQKHFL